MSEHSHAVPIPPGIQVAPSILAADFGALREQVATVIDAGARLIHVDVMDGHFVEPISVGAPVIEALAPQVHAAGGLLEAHLMVERPERHIEAIVAAGAQSLTLHAEATPQLALAIHRAREAGVGVGVAINPGTPAAAIEEVRADVDVALCMTVNPGWGGQPFIARSPEKIARLRALIGPDVALEVDGGIDVRSAPICAQAGASVFVAGAAIFAAPDPGAAYRQLVEALAGAGAPPRR
ncbi:MAG TPA: ribulose-phosphate 3-epimerase [Solirubrobacteraceae bacterium]|nr:ribulose-phosphate 3-epimerase [Solirubrobacteraceae bacterium]